MAHGLGSLEIVGLVAALFLVPPLLLWLLEAVIGVASRAIARSVHGLLVVVLVAASVLPVLNRFAGLTGDVAVSLAIGAGIVASIAYAGRRRVRILVSLLAVSPAVMAWAFFADAGVEKLMQASSRTEPYDVEIEGNTPIVFVVFDELPLTSLLDLSQQIDRARYPNFARLARMSTWYRLASTVHANSIHATTALLSGMLPDAERLPSAADHPENLFNLLAGHYEMDVRESFTRLWRQQRDVPDAGVLARSRALGSDLVVLYLHALLPEDLAERLPPVTRGWSRFADGGVGAPGTDEFEYAKNAPQLFRRFLGRLEASEKPRFYYHHIDLPHRPWRFLPSGEIYFPATDPGLVHNTWSRTNWWAVQGYQRHMLQLGLADRLLGELLDRLSQQGLLDRVLLVVTSDNGASFWPGQARRDPDHTDHPEDLLSVPLFIKAPGQERGRVDRRNVETIDVLPTVADLLGIEVPWKPDGCSLEVPECPQREGKSIWDKQGDRLDYPAEVVLKTDSLVRKLETFGAGNLEALYSVGLYRGLVGRRSEGWRVIDTPTVRAYLDPESFELARVRPDEVVVGRLEGEIHGYPPGQVMAYIAVAVKGHFSAVVPAFARRDGTLFFSAMLSKLGRPESVDDVELYLVEGGGKQLKLRRIGVGAAQRAPGE